MDGLNWQRVEEVFHGALHLNATDRVEFLARECDGDNYLREQVESLIAASENGNGFINQPALSLGMRVLATESVGSLLGRLISHYKIIGLLGNGGMGEVYLAEDCQLEREVALKFLAPGLVDDDEAIEQLITEARAIAKLENPNICIVHGIEQSEGRHFIVMQYVKGDTLATILKSGPLKLSCALEHAEQIVGALSAAHARGIIHRDIKPQNIVVTTDGQAKVLDFGLAKFVQQHPAVEQATGLQTLTAGSGVVVGTVAYMSPEQAKGEALDFHTDMFSFGIVLYQMLTGENPFLRQTSEETLAAIKTTEPPPLTKLPREVRGELGRIVCKCLQKDRAERFETTESLLAALRAQRRVIEPVDPAVLVSRAQRKRKLLQRFAITTVVLLVILLAAGGFIYLKLSTEYSLALLPIENKSADSDLDYLSKGLTHSLLDKFSYLPRLKVKAPTVIAPRTGEQPDIVKLGRELKVDAVLSGEIIKQGDVLLLHLRMLRTADGAPQWEQTFDLNTTDLFTLQNNITRSATSGLGLWLIGRDRSRLTKQQTDNHEALRAYLQGYKYFGKRDRDNILSAIKYFEQARELDPMFARTYAALAESYAIMINVAYGPLSPKQAMDIARYYARQAIEIDPSLSEGHAAMAIIKMRYYWEFPEAEQEFRKAIELKPDFAQAHYGYANLLALRGRFDESIKESEIARDLDPYSPLSKVNCGRALYYARRWDEAETYFRELVAADPDYPQFLHPLGLVLAQQGKFPQAVAVLEKLHDKDPLYAAASLGYVYGKAGRREDALRMIKELERFAKEKPVSPYEKALVYLGMGDKDNVFANLKQAYRDRYPNLINLRTDPIYDVLNGDPRFEDLTRRIGLTP